MGQSQSAPAKTCCNGSATVRTRLDRHTFTAGEVVTGVLYLHIAQPVSLKHVVVKVKREEQGSSRALDDVVTATKQASPETDWGLVTVETESTIIKQQLVAAGTYAYPISLTLPVDAPPSFFVKREASEQNVSLLYWLEAAATMENSATDGDSTICDETLLTILRPSQPHQRPPSELKLLPDQQPPLPSDHTQGLHQRQLLLQQQQQQNSNEAAGVRALVQPALPHPSSGGGVLEKQAKLCGSGVVVVPGTCFRSRGEVSVEVHGPCTLLQAGQPLAVTLQVKNRSAAVISELLVELHQCGAVAEGYVPPTPTPEDAKAAAGFKKGEVSRRLTSAPPLPGLAAGACRVGGQALEVEVPVSRRLQGCVSGKAVRMHYALVVFAVAAGRRLPLELLRVPLDAEDSVCAAYGPKKTA